MTDVRGFKALSLAVSAGVLVVAGCAIQLRGGDDASSPPKAEQSTGLDHSDLARCRSVKPDETASYQHCQHVWAENRRHFFGRTDAAAASRRPDPVADPTPAAKDQSRMPQGYPSVTSREASKP